MKGTPITLSNKKEIFVELPCVLITLDSACDHCISSAKLLSFDKGPIELRCFPAEDNDDSELYSGNDPRSYGDLRQRIEITLPLNENNYAPVVDLDFVSKTNKLGERQDTVIVSSAPLDLWDFSISIESPTSGAAAGEPYDFVYFANGGKYDFVYFANGGKKDLTLKVEGELNFELKSAGSTKNPSNIFSFKAGALVCIPYKQPKERKEAAQADINRLCPSPGEANLYCKNLIQKLQLNYDEEQLLREYINQHGIDKYLFEYVEIFCEYHIEFSCALDVAEYCASDDSYTPAQFKKQKRELTREEMTAALKEWIQELRDDGKII